MKSTRYRWLLPVLLLALLVAVGGCSRKKSGFTHRLYHSTTSHYNWYFNALELMKQSELQLRMGMPNNYLEILPVYILPDEAAQKSLTPTMDQIIEKCSTVIDRHSMEINKREHNKWIDDNFLLIGIANYYKGQYAVAQEMFTYTAKKYKGQESRFEAALWLARTYIEMERYNKALTVLSVIEKDNGKDKPKDFQARLEAVKADLYLRQERYTDAIAHLEDAARLTEERDLQARYTFILAQVYDALGRSADAIAAYEQVVKLRPSYEMEFYARISQALAYDRRLDSGKIKAMLREMAADEKNEEYLDQIYYALAEIFREEQDITQAIAYYQQSAASSVSNDRQKALSFLRLAEIFFADRAYVRSKNYYDSTAVYLPEEYPDYEKIINTGRSLEGLVANLQIIERNDSLLALAALPEKEREKQLMELIVKLEAEEEARRQAELAALQKLQNENTFYSGSSETGSSRGSWYFYNPGALSSGYQAFKQQWGNRKLEDNWRRSNRSQDFALTPGKPQSSDSLLAAAGSAPSKVKSLEEYLAELPLSPEASAAAHYEVIQALYEVGTIYKERLKDDDNAIGSFMRITMDYDTSAYALQSLYQLYRIYYEKEQAGGFVGTGFKDNSEYYKNVILADYPDSEFAKLILNPDYITEKSQRYHAEKEQYERTYKQYNRRQYSEVLITCNTVIRDEPNNNFLAKYMLIKALTVGQRQDATNYEALLREVVAKFPGTPEASRAAELLGQFNEVRSRLARERALQEAATADSSTTTAATAMASSPAAATDSPFTAADGGEHFFALVFPKGEGDATTIKELVATYHDKYYSSTNLRITNSFIDQGHQIVIVRSFDSKEPAMDYYRQFNSDQDLLKSLHRPDYQTFVITTKNFTVLFRNKDLGAYQQFFDSNYL